MVLVAQIIVDVPLMQTDRPYSYLIPEAMQGQIAIGMRVHVPFGKGNRLLQGFVIGLDHRALSDLTPRIQWAGGENLAGWGDAVWRINPPTPRASTRPVAHSPGQQRPRSSNALAVSPAAQG